MECPYHSKGRRARLCCLAAQHLEPQFLKGILFINYQPVKLRTIWDCGPKVARTITPPKMRLLNTTSLELETFVGHVPAYSILSHTWGEEEVTFKDLNSIDPALFTFLNQAFEGHANNPSKLEGNTNQYISPHIKQKKGWEKITKACAHAASQESKYIWIDTCCIDRSNKSELSEAINSMFRWYQSATKCYAYLADVTAVSVLKDGKPREDASNFRISRWFTRGWTLQELLAPTDLEFLDHNWKVIGSRDDWAIKIEKATGIRPEHLTEFRHCCLAIKLS